MAEGGDQATKSLKLPTFDGEQKTFQIWWMRFRAYGTVYGFAQSIKMTVDPNLPDTENTDIDESTDTGARQAKALKLNAIAMCNLTMAFTTESLMGLIYASMTDLWPSGKAQVVVVALHDKYAPKDL
eukprot:4002643-Ditylum_brightwellii.AAC.1